MSRFVDDKQFSPVFQVRPTLGEGAGFKFLVCPATSSIVAPCRWVAYEA